MAINRTKDTLEQAGDYQFPVCEIISYRIHGEEQQPYRQDIRQLVITCELTEDIYSNNMVGALTVFDSQDIRTMLPITGLERLNLKFNTPGMPGINAVEGEGFPFQIYKIDSVRVDPTNPRAQYYKIYFCSQEMYFNSLDRVSKAYAGPLEDGVSQILRSKRFLNSKKKLYIEPTATNTKMVIPNLRPYKAINMMAKSAISGLYENAGYLFYETPQGFFFRSIESLLAMGGAVVRPAKYKYTYQISNVRQGETRDVLADMKNVIQYDFEQPVNTLYNLNEGLYANRTIEHDLYHKTLTTTDFDYADSFGDYFHTEHIDGNKSAFKTTLPYAKFEDTNKDLSSNPLAKLMTHSRTSKVHNDFELISDSETTQKSIPQRLGLRNINLNLQVFGNSLVTAGDIITFDLPLMRPLFGDTQQSNPYYSGRYLVMAIKHIISVPAGRYEMVMKCSKDAVRTEFAQETDDNITQQPNYKIKLEDIYTQDSKILTGDLLSEL